jgi:5-methylcytosine-specific restriction endonuclease McrBC regulatory subunit McrC
MESVLIVAPEEYGAELRRRLAEKWKVSDQNSDAWVIEDQQRRVYVLRNNFVLGELDSQKLMRI